MAPKCLDWCNVTVVGGCCNERHKDETISPDPGESIEDSTVTADRLIHAAVQSLQHC